jgi:c-di-GMP-binding flagellar brake protein YcgR
MTHQHTENPEFAIHNRKEIVFILEDLAKHRVAINLGTQEGAHLVTSVLGVNADANQVYVDNSADEQLNQQITGSQYITFSTQTGVKVRWHSTHLRQIPMMDGGDAFVMLVPSVIERIQRREYFRLNTPQGSRALVCTITAGEETLETNIVDMSVGGIGIAVRGVRHEMFSQGAILEACSIQFPEIGVVPVKLRVCGMWASNTTKSGEQIHRIGLEFVELGRGAGNVIQRYLIQLEAERISLG